MGVGVGVFFYIQYRMTDLGFSNAAQIPER